MKKSMTLTIAGVALATVVGAGAASAHSAKTVKTQGVEKMDPNAKFLSTFRFGPGDIEVRQGETVTWIDHDPPPVPHTITIVKPEDLSVDFVEAYTCLMDPDLLPGVSFDGLCLPFLAAHGGLAFTTPIVNVGGPGLDTPGDSLFLPPDSSVSAQVTAPPGTTLHYMCILHPWMQGTITVK